jgi:membrane-associated phospholipid phosphatase
MPSRARKALIGAAGGTGLLVLVWFFAYHVNIAERADRSILRGFAGLSRHRLDDVTSFIAHLCDPKPYVFLAAVPVVVALLRRRPRVAVTVGLIMLAANTTTQYLKPLLAAPRQPAFGLLKWDAGTWPSGHATAVMALALCMVIAASPRWRPYVGAAMAAFAIAVVYSFLELGWHFPSDVLGGFLVATIWTLLGAAALWTLEARRPERNRELSPSGRPQFSVGEALAPTAVLVVGALGLAFVVALTRPHAVISYASAHEVFIVGAVVIALLVLSLAAAATLALRRS